MIRGPLQGGRSTDVGEEGNSLTTNGGRPIGSTTDKIKKKIKKKKDKNFKRHSLSRRRRKMLLSHIEVCFQGSVLAFKDVASFPTWVQSIQGSSKVIGICGVGAQHGFGDPLLSHFVTLELHLQGPPGYWQRRRIGYLRKRCGHRSIEEEAVKRDEEKASEEVQEFRPVAESFRHVAESFSDVNLQKAPPTAVTSETAGYKYDPRAKEERLCQSQRSSLNLSLLPDQQQPLSLLCLPATVLQYCCHPWNERPSGQEDALGGVVGLTWTICSNIILYGSPGS